MPVNAAARWSPSLRGLVVLLPFCKASSSKSGKLSYAFATNPKRILLVAVNNAPCKKIQDKLHETLILRGVTARYIRRGLCLRVLRAQTADVGGYIGMPA